MKKVNQNNSKLQFRKQAIANLSKSESENVQGGKPAWTTSFGNCSGFLCCSPTKSTVLIDDFFPTLKCTTDNNDNGLGMQPLV